MNVLKNEMELFGIDENVDLKSLKKAYYELSLIVHPDRNTCVNKEDANNEMIYITESYKKLKKILEKRDFENEIINSKDLKENYNETLDTFQSIFYETQDEMFKERNWQNQEFTTDDLVINTKNGFDNEIESEYRNNDFKVKYETYVGHEEKIEDYKTSEEIILIENIGTMSVNNIKDNYPEQSFPNPNLTERLPNEIVKKYEDVDEIEKLLEKKLKEREEF
jgi:DnaJ-class molecular chaperone